MREGERRESYKKNRNSFLFSLSVSLLSFLSLGDRREQNK